MALCLRASVAKPLTPNTQNRPGSLIGYRGGLCYGAACGLS
jgi:hypothetical protein